MSIARITIMEFNDEECMAEADQLYQSIRAEYFPTQEQVINVKTGPTSRKLISLYPSFENAETNLKGRAKMIELLEPLVKDTVYHEGEVTLNITSNPSKTQ